MNEHLTSLQDKLAANLAKEFGADPDAMTEAVGIWDTLLTTLIDLVIDTLAGCIGGDPASAAQRLRNPGFIEKWAVRRAVRHRVEERRDRRPSQNALILTMEQATEEEAAALVEEAGKTNDFDWSLF